MPSTALSMTIFKTGSPSALPGTRKIPAAPANSENTPTIASAASRKMM
jgi:hypothetical protein